MLISDNVWSLFCLNVVHLIFHKSFYLHGYKYVSSFNRSDIQNYFDIEYFANRNKQILIFNIQK